MIPCKICGSDSEPFSSSPEGFPAAKCQRCRLIFISIKVPKPSTSENVLADYYAEVYAESPPKFAFALQELIREVPPPAHLLDFGCGDGSFVALALEAGYTATGFDVDEGLCQLCRRRGLTASSSLDELQNDFDVITAFDVLEHLEDPKGQLMKLSELLKPEGVLFVETPRRSLLNRYLLLLRPVLKSPYWGISVEHLQLFSDKSLRILFEICGFRVTKFWKRQSLSWSTKRRYIRNLGFRSVAVVEIINVAVGVILKLRLFGRNKAVVLARKM